MTFKHFGDRGYVILISFSKLWWNCGVWLVPVCRLLCLNMSIWFSWWGNTPEQLNRLNLTIGVNLFRIVTKVHIWGVQYGIETCQLAYTSHSGLLRGSWEFDLQDKFAFACPFVYTPQWLAPALWQASLPTIGLWYWRLRSSLDLPQCPLWKCRTHYYSYMLQKAICAY